MLAALTRHDTLLRREIESHGGHIVKTTGDGAVLFHAGTFTRGGGLDEFSV